VLGFLNIDSTWNLQRGKFATIFTKVSGIKVFDVNNSGPFIHGEREITESWDRSQRRTSNYNSSWFDEMDHSFFLCY